jgi:hypothetical protein
MRSRLLLGTAAAAALLMAAPLTAANAQTANVLSLGKGGSAISVGSVVISSLEPGTEATFYVPGSTTGVACRTATTYSRVKANPAAPGTAVESLFAQDFRHCSTNIPGVKIQSIAITGLPYAVTVSDAAGDPVVISNASTTTTFSTPAGAIPCSYTDPSVDGNASNIGAKITFTNQEFALTPTSSGACPPAADFSATFGPQKDKSVYTDPHVFVN